MFSRYIAVRKNQWKLKWQTIKELLHIGVPSSHAGCYGVRRLCSIRNYYRYIGSSTTGISSDSDQLCIRCIYGFMGAGTGRFYKSK